MSSPNPLPKGSGRRRGALPLLVGAPLAALALVWLLSSAGPAKARRDTGDLPSGPLPEVPSSAGEPRRPSPAGTATGAASGWRSPLGEAIARAAQSGPPGTPAKPAWEARIRTNGVFEPQRLADEPGYLARFARHKRILALLRSPARETPECQAIIALAERRGLSVQVVPELYNALWEVRTMERRLQQSHPPTSREAMETVGLIELEDFMERFRRHHGVEPGPVFEELLGLDLHPSVFFGIPEILPAQPGDPLLTD
jgi:hypothetical protein